MADNKITKLTALAFRDKDIKDPNSGFYPPQGTSEQINNIPTGSKEIGEVLYNTSIGSLMLFSKTPEESEPSWKIIGGDGGSTGAFIAPSHSEDPTEGVNGQIYYNSDDGDDDTSEEVFRVYADGIWSYLKPSFYASIIVNDNSLGSDLSVGEWANVIIGADNLQMHGFAAGSSILIYKGKYPIKAKVIFNFSFVCDTNNVLFDFAIDKRPVNSEGVFFPVLNLVSTQKLYVADVSTNVTYVNTIDLSNNDQLTIIVRADTDCRIQATCGCFTVTAI